MAVHGWGVMKIVHLSHLVDSRPPGKRELHRGTPGDNLTLRHERHHFHFAAVLGAAAVNQLLQLHHALWAERPPRVVDLVAHAVNVQEDHFRHRTGGGGNPCPTPRESGLAG